MRKHIEKQTQSTIIFCKFGWRKKLLKKRVKSLFVDQPIALWCLICSSRRIYPSTSMMKTPGVVFMIKISTDIWRSKVTTQMWSNFIIPHQGEFCWGVVLKHFYPLLPAPDLSLPGSVVQQRLGKSKSQFLTKRPPPCSCGTRVLSGTLSTLGSQCPITTSVWSRSPGEVACSHSTLIHPAQACQRSKWSSTKLMRRDYLEWQYTTNTTQYNTIH